MHDTREEIAFRTQIAARNLQRVQNTKRQRVTESEQPTARSIAQRLLVRGISERTTSDAVAAGVDDLFAQLYISLSQWVGSAGCRALFARAIILCAPDHPVLRGVRLGHSAPYLPNLGDNARDYGGDATADASEAVLASIITMLNGLIGEDIATNLLEEAVTSAPGSSAETASNTAYDPRRATTEKQTHG